MKHVYFIWDGGTYVKIGSSDNPRRRLKELQTSSPRPLTLLASFAFEDLEDEKWAHERFDSSHALGEWFHFDGQLRAFLSWLGEEGHQGPVGEAFWDFVDDQILWDMNAGFIYGEHDWSRCLQRARAAA